MKTADVRESDIVILKSIKRVSEDFIKNNYPDIYQRVLDYVSDRMKSYSFLHKLTCYIFGVSDFPVCEICGNLNTKEFTWDRRFKDARIKTCSKKCYNLYLARLRKETCLKKYGVANVSKLQSIKDKKKETCLTNYGVDNPSKNQSIQNKKIQTNLERYGSENAMQSDIIKERYKNAFFEKYGVENPMDVEEFRNKLINTNLEKTGYAWNLSNPETVRKSRDACMKKYGVDWPTRAEEVKKKIAEKNKNKTTDDIICTIIHTTKKAPNNGMVCLKRIKNYTTLRELTSNSEYKEKLTILINNIKDSLIKNYGKCDIAEKEIREINKKRGFEKVIQTNIKLYGKPNYFSTEKAKQNLRNLKLKRYYKRYQSSHYSTPLFTEEELLKANNGDILKWKCNTCGKELSEHVNTLFFREVRCKDCYKISVSNPEREIIQFLNDNGINDIECNVRDKLVEGKEIDIYIPSKNIAIEYDGLWWHSSAHILNDSYHLNKTIKCEKKGIQLIHIFENEWFHKKEIVKSRLLDILGKYQMTIYARECEIKEVDQEEAKEFLNNNHLQGFIVSKYRIGLYYDNELVSLMTFSNYRKSLGRESIENEYEMLRFCNEMSCHIPGAASKLLNYFIKTYHPKKIISYCDRRWSQGKLYDKLGFKFIRNTEPNYWYIIGYRLQHRFEWRKSVLKDKLLKYDESKTEFENMTENGYNRIYDCGNKLYELSLED